MATEIDQLTVRVSADTTPFQAALRDLVREADGFAGAITRAFKDAVVRGKDFESVLKSLALRLADIALGSALKPIENAIGNAVAGLFGGLAGKLTPFAEGGAVSGGRVKPFAKGGVIAAPTYFPLARGVGLAGEAGPEAILPLARGADGRLGVAAGGSGGVSVTFNITTADAASFQKSEAQVTAMLARAVRRGRRGM